MVNSYFRKYFCAQNTNFGKISLESKYYGGNVHTQLAVQLLDKISKLRGCHQFELWPGISDRIRDSESCAELLLERMDTSDINFKDSGGRCAGDWWDGSFSNYFLLFPFLYTASPISLPFLPLSPFFHIFFHPLTPSLCLLLPPHLSLSITHTLYSLSLLLPPSLPPSFIFLSLPPPRTAVHAAAFSDNIDCMQLLVSRGGATNLADNMGRTPLMMAAYFGHTNVIGTYVLISHFLHTSDYAAHTMIRFPISRTRTWTLYVNRLNFGTCLPVMYFICFVKICWCLDWVCRWRS